MPEAPPYVLDPSGFAQDPLATMLQPFDSVFVGFSLVVFWGLLVGILWLRTHNPMLISVIGIVMVAGYLATPEIVYGGTRIFSNLENFCTESKVHFVLKIVDKAKLDKMNSTKTQINEIKRTH